MVTLNGEKKPRLCDWLLGKRVYLQFFASGNDHGAKMGGIAVALDDHVLVLQDDDRVYFVPWSSVRWVHPLIDSAAEREQLASWVHE
jgi:hypothetical protein